MIRVKLDLTKIEVEHSYRFDSAYDETVSNEELYDDAIRPLINHFFQGAKVSCFAYGQTGSGKTYTMIGDMRKGIEGLYLMAARDIFEEYLGQYSETTIEVSYFEIYCGKLFDLLNSRKQLIAREDGKGAIVVVGLMG